MSERFFGDGSVPGRRLGGCWWDCAQFSCYKATVVSSRGLLYIVHVRLRWKYKSCISLIKKNSHRFIFCGLVKGKYWQDWHIKVPNCLENQFE